MDKVDRLFTIMLRRNAQWGVAACVASFSVAAAARLVLPLAGFPLVTFYPAVIVSALVGGWMEGAAVAAGALLYAWYFFPPNPFSFQLDIGTLVGLVSGAVVFAIEITLIEMTCMAARRAMLRQRRADDLVAERDLMFSELQHRVANNMQFIAGLLILQSRRLAPGQGREALADSASRLTQFARIHRKLHDAPGAEIGFEGVASDVLTDLFRATGCGGVALNVQADPVALPLETRTTLILITTEAATNSIKHVFSKSLGSRFAVSLQRLAPDQVQLTLADDGPGFAPAPGPTAEISLGMRIIDALVQRLHGTLSMTSDNGAVVRIVFAAA